MQHGPSKIKTQKKTQINENLHMQKPSSAPPRCTPYAGEDFFILHKGMQIIDQRMQITAFYVSGSNSAKKTRHFFIVEEFYPAKTQKKHKNAKPCLSVCVAPLHHVGLPLGFWMSLHLGHARVRGTSPVTPSTYQGPNHPSPNTKKSTVTRGERKLLGLFVVEKECRQKERLILMINVNGC